jgi:spore coat protein U-like protein
LAFGSYDPIGSHASSDLDATGTVTVTCTNGSTGDITLGQGSNADTGSTDDVPLRRMSDGASGYLSYYLYQDSGRTTVWGNTAATDVSHSGDGTATDITIYGRVTSGQNAPAGSYTDTVVATVTF